MTDKRDRKETSAHLRAGIAKELAAPRIAKSARIAELDQHTRRVSLPPSVSMPGTADKIIPPSRANQPEHVQIGVDGADPGYRDLRIENILINEHNDLVSLAIGASVDITVTAKPKI